MLIQTSALIKIQSGGCDCCKTVCFNGFSVECCFVDKQCNKGLTFSCFLFICIYIRSFSWHFCPNRPTTETRFHWAVKGLRVLLKDPSFAACCCLHLTSWPFSAVAQSLNYWVTTCYSEANGCEHFCTEQSIDRFFHGNLTPIYYIQCLMFTENTVCTQY